MKIRQAGIDDAAACAAIYTPYVIETPITLEYDAPSVVEMARRIEAALATHDWIVVEDDDGTVFGYAYGGPYRGRAGFLYACEVSIYIDLNRHRTGAGKALYTTLFDRLAERGFKRAVAAVTMPNEPSVGIHTALGFEMVGVHQKIAWKFDRWVDMAYLQRDL
ncbi:GNAT family N-acetyltransferase [Jongsikchunia kroppenstedtii]|uniref:GNAT family N-acetyltransferase n=1 Tax=Jongsikchunia kroppenstedtii TaxID=1121721 RepID=UPI00036D5C59|nr:GNAT family N-acetyltransferase [Jongsikchunia kroppenstedtii]